MTLDQRTRSATHDLLDRTTPDTARLLGELHRTRRRRGAGRVLVAAAVVAAAVGVGVRLGDDGSPEPAGPAEVRNGAFVVERSFEPGAADLDVLGGSLAHLPPDAASGAPVQFDGVGGVVYADRRDTIRRLDLTSGSTTALGTCPEEVCWPALSPDGTTLAFGGPGRITLLDVATGGTSELPLPRLRDAFTPVWSPDGRTLAFLAPDGVWSVPVDGGDPRLLHPGSTIKISRPSWAPDGRRIALVDQTEMARFDYRFRALVVDLETGDVTDLGDAGRCACMRDPAPQVVWSPDGSLVAVVGSKGAELGPGIYLVPPEGGEWRLQHGGYFTSVAWQPVVEQPVTE